MIIRKFLVVLGLFTSLSYAGEFKITSNSVTMDSDMNAICSQQFGGTYQLADWTNNVISNWDSGKNVDNIIPHASRGERDVWVSNNGSEFWTGSRHYLAARFSVDHVLPTSYTFLAHDNIDNNLLALGSWNSSLPILCYSEQRTTPVTTVPVTTTPVNNGLVAYYPFNGNANDESGNGYDGTVNGATLTTDRFGNLNSAYSFSGNDFIWIGDIQTQHITLSAWFQTNSTSTMGIARWRLYGYGVFLNNQSIGDITGFVYNSPNDYNNNALNKNQGLNDGNWHHVALTFDGLQNKLYLDGHLISSITVSVTDSSIFYGAGGLGFGRDGNSPNSYFIGSIDDISIYSNALSESEIQQLYNKNSIPSSNSSSSCTSPKAITVSENLDIQIPSLNYTSLLGTQNLWVNLKYYGKGSNGEILWKLKDFGTNP